MTNTHSQDMEEFLGVPSETDKARTVSQFAYRADQVTDLTGQVEPPADLRVWELSWSRKRALMRIRDTKGREWYFRSLIGKGYVLGGDETTGRMFVRARVLVQPNGSAYLYRE